jgi:hypothetical protein
MHTRLFRTSAFGSHDAMRFKVQVRYTYGWDDAGWTEGVGVESEHLRFQSVNDAQAALEQFFNQVKEAVAAGNTDTEEVREDYRIVATDD